MLKFIRDVLRGDFEYPEGIYDESPFWDWVKSFMCRGNWIANIAYLFWGDLECPCCAWWRGVFMGIGGVLVTQWLA